MKAGAPARCQTLTLEALWLYWYLCGPQSSKTAKMLFFKSLKTVERTRTKKLTYMLSSEELLCFAQTLGSRKTKKQREKLLRDIRPGSHT